MNTTTNNYPCLDSKLSLPMNFTIYQIPYKRLEWIQGT